MKEIVTKVSIKVSDDGGKCDEDCPFLITYRKDSGKSPDCRAFHTEIENMERCIPCFAREDVTYQIVGE